jgi:hypothetical protein
MIFGDDKPRQMARSILPSRWRGAPRERALLHRSERRKVHVTMCSLARDPSAWDDETDVDTTVDVEISTFVQGRRSADKLNHFERWAVERTRGLPAHERLGHLRGVLPDGLIGFHAMIHLERRRELRPSQVHDRAWKRKRTFLERGEVAQLLRRVCVTPGAHRLFNRVLRAAVVHDQQARPVPMSVRPLLGLHDVLPFLDDVERGWDMRPLRAAVDRFCREFKGQRFDPEATARAFPRVLELPLYDFTWAR